MRIINDVVATEAEAVSALGLHRAGRNVRVVARRLTLGEGVVLEDDVVLAGDEISIGDDVTIRAGADLRSQTLRIGARSLIGEGVRVLVADRFEVGVAARISHDVEITCRSFEAGELLFFGDGLIVGGGGHMESTAHVKLGNRVALGSHCMLNANRAIQLDDQVGSGDYLSLWTHGFHFGHSVLDGYGTIYEPIHIERNVWLAHHVTVLPGVSIGENTIIGACSVVNKTLPANVVAAGVPAKVRRPLEAHALDDESAWREVWGILRQWAEEMRWKGWRVEGDEAGGPVPQQTLQLTSPLGERICFLHLLTSSEGEKSNLSGDFGIIVSLDERPTLAERLPQGWALFELRAHGFRGSSFDAAEDLRDFLRRHSIPCGSERLFESIEPVAFRRLKALI
jgi:acetyltransferase-like isoleucine patch superfamily enzyme